MTRVLENHLSTFPHVFPAFFFHFFKILEIVWVDFDNEFCVGASISLTFDFGLLSDSGSSIGDPFFSIFSTFPSFHAFLS